MFAPGNSDWYGLDDFIMKLLINKYKNINSRAIKAILINDKDNSRTIFYEIIGFSNSIVFESNLNTLQLLSL